MNLEPYTLVSLTAQHAREMRRLIGAPREPKLAPTASKAVMLVALQAAEIDLLQTIAALLPLVTPQQSVCGHWTLQMLLGHLADWDRYFDNWLASLTGKPMDDLYWDDDGAAFNAWLCNQRQGESWSQSWDDFRSNRQTLLDHLQAVPEVDFLQEQPNSRSFPSVYHCAWSALEHYLDHATGLRREVKMPVAEELWHFHGPYTD